MMSRHPALRRVARPLALLLAVLSLCLTVAPVAGAAPADVYASPEAAVDAFFAGLNQHSSYRAAWAGLPGANIEGVTAVEFASIINDEKSQLTHVIYRSERDGDRSTVLAYLPEWSYSYRFELVRQQDSWYIARYRDVMPAVIEHARADLTVDPAGRQIAATVTLRVRSDMDDLSDLLVYLFPTLKVAGVTRDGAPTSFERPKDSRLLHVPLPQLKRGETTEVTFAYSGAIHDKDRYTARIWNDISGDGTYLATSLGWSGAETADLYITVPPGLTAAAGGELIETTNAASGGTTFHFRQDEPAAALAVNEYTAADEIIDGIAVHWDLLPEHAGQGAMALAVTRQALAFFSGKFGPFPFPRLTISEIPAKMGGGVTVDQAIMLVPRVTPGLSHSRYWPELVAHEIAHQWWGTDIGSIHPWGWEAFASYAADAFIQATEGDARFQEFIRQHRAAYLKATRLGEVPILRARNRYENRAYFEIVYDKGALVLHMLRYQIGDEAFWKTMRVFAEEFAGQQTTPWDFERVAEEVSGQDLSGFFFQWLNTTQRLDLSVEHYQTTFNADGYLTTLTIVNRGTATVPFVDIALDGLGEPLTMRVELKGKATTVSVLSKAAPRRVILDPQHWLLDANEANNIAGVGPFDRGSPIRAGLIGLAVALVLFGLGTAFYNYGRRVGWARVRRSFRDALDMDEMNTYITQHGIDFDPDKVIPDIDYSLLPGAERVAIERPELWHDGIATVLATDVGSTTT
ncbi:MAG: M1 family aminopeptidase [Chloroflexota bacterium]